MPRHFLHFTSEKLDKLLNFKFWILVCSNPISRSQSPLVGSECRRIGVVPLEHAPHVENKRPDAMRPGFLDEHVCDAIDFTKIARSFKSLPLTRKPSSPYQGRMLGINPPAHVYSQTDGSL
ncbi:hypothetical protein VN97_g2484 [Penicillium thymicola]|uniref:Uncharacterized protein n=1 Tax=Penicillium thymicola TaxID=293382 RepID=A0AAI9TP22_PENTH|nr:hypothetical protein VN97_g2484 [Penicillium thymicola]